MQHSARTARHRRFARRAFISAVWGIQADLVVTVDIFRSTRLGSGLLLSDNACIEKVCVELFWLVGWKMKPKCLSAYCVPSGPGPFLGSLLKKNVEPKSAAGQLPYTPSDKFNINVRLLTSGIEWLESLTQSLEDKRLGLVKSTRQYGSCCQKH